MDNENILGEPEGDQKTAAELLLEEAVLGKLSVPHESSGAESQEDDSFVSLSPSGEAQRRETKRPDTAHLSAGVVKGPDGELLPLFKEGDRIVVERDCSLLVGNPWLDTYVYRVTSIDDETGELVCRDEDCDHHAVVSFKSPHQRVFLCPAKGNPFTETTKKLMAREESRPDKGAVPAGKKGRGRPVGTKNRSREVVAAEKRAKAEAKREKKERKKTR